jgi:hypothetical protein
MLSDKQPATGYELLLIYAENIAGHAGQILGDHAALLLPLGTARHNVAPATDMHPWHTDARFFKPHGHGVTTWLTLDDVGETAPSIEFGGGAPILPAGTALMFGSNVRHRTQPISGDRVSVEFRCMALAKLGDNAALLHATFIGSTLEVWRQGRLLHRAVL